jgi:hypothetical protein
MKLHAVTIQENAVFNFHHYNLGIWALFNMFTVDNNYGSRSIFKPTDKSAIQ